MSHRFRLIIATTRWFRSWSDQPDTGFIKKRKKKKRKSFSNPNQFDSLICVFYLFIYLPVVFLSISSSKWVRTFYWPTFDSPFCHTKFNSILCSSLSAYPTHTHTHTHSIFRSKRPNRLDLFPLDVDAQFDSEATIPNRPVYRLLFFDCYIPFCRPHQSIQCRLVPISSSTIVPVERLFISFFSFPPQKVESKTKINHFYFSPVWPWFVACPCRQLLPRAHLSHLFASNPSNQLLRLLRIAFFRLFRPSFILSLLGQPIATFLFLT